MRRGLIKPSRHDERGITGLETAIILIAFVVVAAVFAYTVLSAGLFSTQKSQEAIYAGLKETQSTLVLKGSVVATANSTGSSGKVQQVSFIVSNGLGNEAIDFTAPTENTSNTGTVSSSSNNKVVISYLDEYQEVNDLYWTVTKLGNSDGDNLLEANEKFKITIGSSQAGANGGNLVDALTPDLSVNTKFSISILAPSGAVLTIERTTPGYIDQIMELR